MFKNGFLKVACVTPEIEVGNPKFNIKEIQKALKKSSASITIFPELTVSGYSCADLFFQSSLIEDVNEGIELFLKENTYKGIVVIGAPISYKGSLFNCAIVIEGHKILGIVPKRSLPNSHEFYEKRWFKSSSTIDEKEIFFLNEMHPFGNILFSDYKHELFFGIEICEDMWATVTPGNLYALNGANIIMNISASNETLGKSNIRKNTVLENSRRNNGAYIYASAGATESTTDTVFSGHNIVAENGVLLVETENFSTETEIVYADIDLGSINFNRRNNTNFHDDIKVNFEFDEVLFTLPETDDYSFCHDFSRLPFVPCDDDITAFNKIASIQEYALFKRLKHTEAKTLIIGVSGGLDSTLALLVAYQAFIKLKKDPKDIIAVTMPGLGTSDRTKSNAIEMMKKLGVTLLEKPITEEVLSHFKTIEHDPNLCDVTYENAQARIRTLILMNLSNMHKGLVLGTGDMSEIALGFSTYNGDHMSMYQINCGIPKTLVRYMVKNYALHKFPTIKETLLDVVATPITPELIKDQKTEDLVGKYEINDFILHRFLISGDSESRIKYLLKLTFKELSDTEVSNYVDNFFFRFFSQQFKRQAAPDGPKVLSVGLSARTDYRMPSDIKRW